MNAQRYLQQIKILDTKIKQKEDQYFEIYNAATNAGEIRFDKELVQTTRTGDRTEKLVIKYSQLEKEISEQKLKFHEIKNRIINEIQELSDDRYINILYKRYVEYKNYEVISKEMRYSFDYVKELHRNSIKAFEEKHPTISHYTI